MSRIVVELAQPLIKRLIERAHQGARDCQSLDEVARELGLRELAEFLARPPFAPDPADRIAGSRPTSAPLVRRRPLVQQQPRISQAIATRSRPYLPLAGFFAIDLDDIPESRQDAILGRLQSLRGVVETASFEPSYRETSPDTTETLQLSQDYLDAIGATPTPGANWHGIGFAVLDGGWFLEHEALQHLPTPTFFPDNHHPASSHGTKVLGVIVGGPRMRGIAVGATPKALIFFRDKESLAETLLDFLYDDRFDNLSYGDVLLIELEHGASRGVRPGLPLEVHRDVFQAIQFAASQGVVVIEAAGNGSDEGTSWDLDAIAQDDSSAPAWSPRRRPSPESPIPDSGAILVSGCLPDDTASVPSRYTARPGLNFGSRVDCYGWGSGVATCGVPHDYVPDFSMTSSAAAMVAGIALAIQRMAFDIFDSPLSPAQMRSLFKNPSAGVPVYRDGRVVGIVPHLGRVYDLLMQIPRIVASRSDEIGAGGPDPDAVPSPIVVPRALNGEIEDDATPIQSHRAYHVFVPVRNEGDSPAGDVRAAAYWSLHAGLDEEVVWHELGESAAVIVPPGNTTVWVGPIELSLPADLSSPSGKIDILVSVGTSLDPRPLLPPARNLRRTGLSRAELANFLQANAGTAMRTFVLT
jgi:hypothetical protein